MKTTRLLRLLPLVALLLGACGSTAAPASSSAGPASAAASAAPAASRAASAAASPAGSLTKLTVSYGELVPQTMPVWLAKDAGIFQQNGLDVDLKLIVSSAEVAAMV